ncbi:hypothetical protein BH23CHL8_BH23CHL8_25600 [soil metagenome]
MVPFGEAAWLLELGDRVDEALSARTHALAARIDAERTDRLMGTGPPVPAYGSVLVTFDPERVDAGAVHDVLAELAVDGSGGSTSAGRSARSSRSGCGTAGRMDPTSRLSPGPRD